MTKKTKKLLLDIAERTFWTAAQVALAGAVVWAAGLNPIYIAALAPAFAAAKGYIASHVGNDKTAATLPSSVDK